MERRMDEISVVVNGRSTANDSTWWLEILDPDETPIPLDGSEWGLWSGNFVPPPPRPIYLEESASADSLTMCDLCSWAWRSTKGHTTDNITLGASTKVEWVVTLVIVSLLSAVIGAVIMVTVLYCRSRIKTTILNDGGNNGQRPPIAIPDDKVISLTFSNSNGQSKGIWSCIFKKSSSTPQLDAPPASSTENHYTHMDETYNSTDEALYAELDRYSTNSPAYQNSGYTDPDIPSSSAPSSAYYSDLSVNTVNDRTYEVVGLATNPDWEISDPQRKSIVKLSSISETVTVPSDYV